MSASGVDAAEAPLRLRAAGTGRALPARWLGYNSPAPYNVPIEDPALLSALRTLRPHYLRFPGGTVANYYQWRTGQLLLGEHPDHPVYRQYALRSRELHPSGVFVAQYIELARAVDAELIVVPNLETSSVAEQAAWFAKMNEDGFAPARIEMGNEFFLALMMNPVTLRMFPDWETTIRLTQQYVEAIRPHIDANARIAVQAAGSAFHNPDGRSANPYAVDPDIGRRVAQRERQWDADMRPEPWFHAVTLHLYPTIEGSAGAGALPVTASNVDTTFAACMARVDEGYDRALSSIAARMPDKEIWVTEWGAYEPRALLHGAAVTFDGMWFHIIVRSILAMLRHPQVTIATNHSLFCDGNLMSACRRTEEGALTAINAASAISWFCEASHGPGVQYIPVAVDGARRLRGGGTIEEGYRNVDACLFRRDTRHALIVHNASSQPRQLDLSQLVPAEASFTARVMATPDLSASLQRDPPQALPLTSQRPLRVEAYSLARIDWVA